MKAARTRPLGWLGVALLALATLASVSALAYAYRSGVRMATVDASLVNATMEIRFEITLGHLWFEKILYGNRQESMDEVWRHYDAADRYARAMLEGGENARGRLFPLVDTAMREDVQRVRDGLAAYRQITIRRWKAKQAAAAGTPLDQKYDRMFRALLAQANSVEDDLRTLIAEETTRFRWTLGLLIAFSVFSFCGAGWAIRRRAAERNLAERQAAAERENLERIVGGIGAGLSVLDAETRVIWANDILQGWFGPLDEIRGRLCHELYDLENPEEQCAALRCLKSGQVEKGELFVRTVQGEQKYFQLIAVPEQDPSGRIVQFVELTVDITDHKRGEEDLRREKELSDDIINSLPGLFYVFDEKRFLRWNDEWEKVTGYSSEEVGRMYGPDFFEGQDKTHVAQRMQAVFRDGTATVEAELVTKDGRRIPYFFTGLRKTALAGKPCLIGLGIDITQRKRAEQERRHLEAQIQHAQKLESLGILAGGIAHDFNNLLMAILGNADLALMEMAPEAPARENITDIKKASQRAAELAKQMLAYSGKGRFVIEVLDLSRVVEEMAHMLEVSVSKKAVLKYNFAENLPAIEGDATQIRQVIMNLITNASEAIGEASGIISITTGAMQIDRRYLQDTYLDENLPEGLYVTLEVADTGCGMDAETRAKLFDPFFTTKFAGRGLGMAAVLGIVRGHHGAIKIYSEPGKGTTTKVLLPAVSAEKVAVSEQAGADDSWRSSATVLLVDDEETVRAIGRMMLEHLGLTVITASDGCQAIDIFGDQGGNIDCVILDLTMPHMDGEEAFRELRRIRKDICIIMSSGYNQQEVTQRFVGKGMAGFIQKPYELRALAHTLQSILGR